MSTERIHKLNTHDLAAYLRRMADLAEQGKAIASVAVEHEDPYERVESWTGQVGYVARRFTGEKHKLEIQTFERVSVKRCERCGQYHDENGCADESPHTRALRHERFMAELRDDVDRVRRARGY